MNISYFILLIPCYIFLGVFIYVQNNHKHVLATIFKGLASLCFFFFAVYQIIHLSNQKITINIKYTIDIFIALGFGVLGDILLNLRDLFKKPIKNYISLGGVIAFFIGHAFYLVHLFKLMSYSEFNYIHVNQVYIPILIALVMIGGFIYLIHKFIDKSKGTKIVAVIYVTIISLLVAVAGFNMISALNNSKGMNINMRNYFITMFVACFAFASSDAILIFNSFGRHPRRLISALNLVIYYTAQLLMGVSVLFFYMGNI